MAFQKTFITKSGVNATYWKICVACLDKVTNKYSVRLCGYPTKAESDNGKESLGFKKYSFPYAGTLIGEKNVETFLYEKLKLHPDWVDAIEV